MGEDVWMRCGKQRGHVCDLRQGGWALRWDWLDAAGERDGLGRVCGLWRMAGSPPSRNPPSDRAPDHLTLSTAPSRLSGYRLSAFSLFFFDDRRKKMDLA